MPNTEPPIDTQATVEFIQHQAARADNCNVFVVACVSKNREGKELAELGQLVAGRRRGLQRRRRAGLRRRTDAPGLRILPDVRQADPQSRRSPRADPRRRDARRAGLAGAGPARHAGRGRRRDDRPRHRAGRGHRRPAAHHARLDRRQRRPDSPGQEPRRARHDRSLPAPLHADRRVPAHVRLELQDEPAAARPATTSRPASPAWSTARST